MKTKPEEIKLVNQNLPAELQEELALYQSYIESGLLPEKVDSAQKALVISKAGQEFGFKPLFSMCHLYIVDGTPSMDGRAMSLLARANGYHWRTVQDFTSIKQLGFAPEFVNKQTIIEMWHVSDPLNKEQARFTLGDAAVAGLIDKWNWKTYPQFMLWWRCFSKIANRLGATSGGLLHDESGLKMIPEKPDITNLATDESIQTTTEAVDRQSERSVSDNPDDSKSSEKCVELSTPDGKRTTKPSRQRQSAKKAGGNLKAAPKKVLKEASSKDPVR